MSEISGERIEPAARGEPQGPGGQSDSGSRRQRLRLSQNPRWRKTQKRQPIKSIGWFRRASSRSRFRMMDSELTTSLDLLERRLTLMRQLASSLEQAQTSVVRSDLRGIDNHTVRQRDLCEALSQLEGEARRREVSAGKNKNDQQKDDPMGLRMTENAISPEVRQRRKSLAEELVRVELQVSQLNRVYAGLLRRAQRTLQIFLRVLAGSGNTYAAPKHSAAIAPPSIQEVSHV